MPQGTRSSSAAKQDMEQQAAKGMSFDEVLEKYRSQAFSERDKGTRFERLMQNFLLTHPLYVNQLTDVWMWNDFPYKNDFGGRDVGIDLVARDIHGDFTAVQCKCFAADATIDKPAVDSFLATSGKRFQKEDLQSVTFSHRLWISTTNRWNREAENTIHNQEPPVYKINLDQLQDAKVEWGQLDQDITGAASLKPKKTLMLHQQTAVNAAHEHYATSARGKMIMACGTGKTFTALKIAEQESGGNGTVLFLVPSIALLGQALLEWSADADNPLKAICVCSDPDVSKGRKNKDSSGVSVADLAMPASTNVPYIVKQFERHRNAKQDGMTVIFSTYQSIEVVSKVQKKINKQSPGGCVFDMVICDEAHRTTGVTLAGDDESAFVQVHDNDVIQAKKRLYMTATPRLYNEDSKSKAKNNDALLCSMDDEALYGEDFYRIGFGEAVERNLLSDYKVLVLTLPDDQISKEMQKVIANGDTEINTDDASKLIGCINALSKRMLVESNLLTVSDPEPMRRAVAFCQSIKVSKQIKTIFNTYKDAYYENLTAKVRKQLVYIEADHIDGTMPMGQRSEKLNWLKSAPPHGMECRILNNVRCLSEGVDVPSLDAVLFLSARNSQVDVVQSVGRVMRRAPGKKYGYIIIPVVVPAGVTPEEALADNTRFKVVWSVLNALRAHDDRFNATVNKIELNRNKPDQILVGGVPSHDGEGSGSSTSGDKPAFDKEVHEELGLQFTELQSVIYARMVQKVGSKRYWEQWAADVADIATRNIARINRLIAMDAAHRQAFDNFLAGLQKNINPSISQDDAVEMLSQHIITRPVFEALFEEYSFVKSNPISISMQHMMDLLEEQALDKDLETLDRFYHSVRQRAEGIDNAEGKQRIIIELYDKFFKTAFPKVVEKLGIVYTPVEVVDFIIHSVADVLQQEFGRSLSDENVHILDPFTGTGTFITRLLQSGRIDPAALQRKYERELHANEIVLLAYYIASINIENAFHDLLPPGSPYKTFEGICLTDTFQLGEQQDTDKLFSDMFPKNSDRVIAQRKAPIRVIMGNPPYSMGQKSANDNAQNQSYARLEERIAGTYVQASTANLNRSSYDSYIKAFRWASDRLDPQNGGIIAFVSNGAWLDGNSADGFRKCIEEEFSSIYVFNLRGGQRTSGDVSRREGGKIFGSGSRNTIAITLLVRNPAASNTKATIHYRDIGDYLSREEKLKIVAGMRSITNPELDLQSLQPNSHGDWINQRSGDFDSNIPLAADKKFNADAKSFFIMHSMGLATNRDAWVWNSSKRNLASNIKNTLAFYNLQRESYANRGEELRGTNVNNAIVLDPKQISWTRALKKDLVNNYIHKYDENSIRNGAYRPYFKQHIYFNKALNEMMLLTPKLFPTPEHENLVICVSGVGVTKEFSTIITDTLPDLELIGKSQCFPLYYFEDKERVPASLFDKGTTSYARRDGITDFILKQAQDIYGNKTSKEDIFYYVYGLLHSPEYRSRYSADLKKMLPRIPLLENAGAFRVFGLAGRRLADLHLHYEDVEPAWGKVTKKRDNFRVEKMRFAKNGKEKDKSTIIYNNYITVSDIPPEAYEYVVNGKSAIEWIMERYAITIHKASGIRNDPNDWAKEQGNPRYILELLLRIITVSMDTVGIVKSLPPLPKVKAGK